MPSLSAVRKPADGEPPVEAGGLGATIWSICAMRSRMAGRLILLCHRREGPGLLKRAGGPPPAPPPAEGGGPPRPPPPPSAPPRGIPLVLCFPSPRGAGRPAAAGLPGAA